MWRWPLPPTWRIRLPAISSLGSTTTAPSAFSLAFSACRTGRGPWLLLSLNRVLHHLAQGGSEAARLGRHAAAEENRSGGHRDGDAVRRGCGPEWK